MAKKNKENKSGKVIAGIAIAAVAVTAVVWMWGLMKNNDLKLVLENSMAMENYTMNFQDGKFLYEIDKPLEKETWNQAGMVVVSYADYNNDKRIRIMTENGEVIAKKLLDEAEFDDGYSFDNIIGNGIAVKNLGSELLKHANEFTKHDNVFEKDEVKFEKDDVKFELHDVKIVVNEKYVSRVEYDVNDAHFEYVISKIGETKFEMPTEYRLVEE